MAKGNNFYGRRFNERLQALRKEKKFTLAELAKKVGVSHVQILNYEKGEIPNAIVIVKIAEALDSTVEYLIKGNDADILKSILPKISALNSNDQEALLKVLDGFIKSREFMALAASTK